MTGVIIRDIAQFRKVKAELLVKWGEKLIYHTAAELQSILADCAPLAKYGKMPAEKIHMALVRTYTEPEELK